MTHLPLESRDVWGQPGPDYEPSRPPTCAHPFCDKHYSYSMGGPSLELHHLWPRSFLRNQPQNWVKLPDGRVVGNLVYLCREHHRQITENEARIRWAAYKNKFHWIDEKNEDEAFDLNPQPPLSQSAIPDDSQSESVLRSPLEVFLEPYTPTPGVFSPPEIGTAPAPGEDCELCKRRMPHPKKESSPQTSVVKSWRMPAEEKENRENTIADAASHLGISQTEKFWMDKLILALCVIALQQPGGLDGD